MAGHLQLALFLAIGVVFQTSKVFAAHPLITDDTGTQGRGGFQVEANGMLGYERDGKTRERTDEYLTNVSYGLGENTDLVFGVPYQRSSVRDGTGAFKSSGIGDMTLELKWRFYQSDGFSLALKPGVSFPTGNCKKGLGTGRVAPNSFVVITQELFPWTFHANLGYGRNENRISERRNIWHVSFASEFEAVPGLKLVGNIAAERSTEKSSNLHPASVIAGFIYSVSRNLDINFGIQFGLTQSETDYTIHPGIAYKFTLQ